MNNHTDRFPDGETVIIPVTPVKDLFLYLLIIKLRALRKIVYVVVFDMH